MCMYYVCLKDHKPFREVKESHAVNSFFNVELCTNVIGALLKQLSEKLNAVRLQAGQCLEKLLCSPAARMA